jgi:hypothetical protein
MKSSLRLAFVLSLALSAGLCLDIQAQSGQPRGANGISMTIYPVVRGSDGHQYLITPSGKQVTVPGLGIAQNATEVSVYRDQANHFWYTNIKGQQIPVTPVQLEAAQAQINAQSTGVMPPQTTPPPKSYYNSTPSYAAGYNGIPYGTQVNMDGPGHYSYTAANGNKQVVSATPQISAQLNQWQQQVPYGQDRSGGAQQMHGSSYSSDRERGGQSRMDARRGRRADRLDNRSQNQASYASSNREHADSNMESGQVLGTGIRSRRSGREQRRSNREDRRADRLNGQ